MIDQWARLLFCFVALNIYITARNCIADDGVLAFTYADGSGNVYEIGASQTRTLEYKPVKPEFSSSGIYDGGEAFSLVLSQQEYESLVSVLEKAISAKQHQIADRVMMSGMIIMDQGNKQERFILEPGCAELLAVEEVLATISGKLKSSDSVESSGLNEKEVVIAGTAAQSKMGALLIAENGSHYFIVDKANWDAEACWGKTIRVKGNIETRSFEAADLKDSDGQYSQGLSGEVLFIRANSVEIVK